MFRFRSGRQSLLAKRSEPRPKFSDEEFRLFPGGEVRAFVELVVMDEIGVRLLCPTARRRVDFVREDADGNRDLDAPGVEEAAGWILRAVPIEARRRDRGVG